TGGSKESPYFDIGYKHGQALPLGKANMVFVDSHVEGRTLSQTNGIILNFRSDLSSSARR
ncbi:hypothetical protein N8703_03395, partial [Verrucomicrobia bacterium]|nr:hypothetical protein [Verrucomicrobiota bacterium]